jgi:hypothetical protein
MQQDQQKQHGPAKALESSQEEAAASESAALEPTRAFTALLKPTWRRKLAWLALSGTIGCGAEYPGETVGLQSKDQARDGYSKGKEIQAYVSPLPNAVQKGAAGRSP